MKTLFYIDNMMAITHAVRSENLTQEGNLFKWMPPRKRKSHAIRPDNNSFILLEGNAPFFADSEEFMQPLLPTAIENPTKNPPAMKTATKSSRRENPFLLRMFLFLFVISVCFVFAVLTLKAI